MSSLSIVFVFEYLFYYKRTFKSIRRVHEKGIFNIFCGIFRPYRPYSSINLKGKGQKGGGLSGLSGEASFSVLCPDGNVKILLAKEYLFGVLCAEMSPESPDEALKAQAVAAFSFAKYKASERRKNPPADLCGADLYADSSKDQGYIPKEEAVKNGVKRPMNIQKAKPRFGANGWGIPFL